MAIGARTTGPHNRVSEPVYRLLQGLGICSRQPTKRGSKGFRPKPIPVHISGPLSGRNPWTDQRPGVKAVSLTDSHQLTAPNNRLVSGVTEHKHGCHVNVNNLVTLTKAATSKNSVVPSKQGKAALTICCLNTQSVNNKALSIAELIRDSDIDVLALTETWLGTATDQQVLCEMVPAGYECHHVPRQDGRRGGGVAVVYRSSLSLKILHSTSDKEFTHLEHLDCVISGQDSMEVRLCTVYRPPSSSKNGLKMCTFLEEWAVLLDQLTIAAHRVIITGDINIHMDDVVHPDTVKFSSVLDSHGFSQHVHGPTHKGGHTLDLVLTRDTDTVLDQLPVVTDPCLFNNHGETSGDHLAVIFHVKMRKPRAPKKQVSYRKLKDINVSDFVSDIQLCPPLSTIDGSLEELVCAYNENLSAIVDKHAPLCTKVITMRPNAPWFTDEVREAKHERRRRERLWRRTKLCVHREWYREQCRTVAKLVLATKHSYYTDQVSQCGRDQKKLFRVTKKLLGDTGKVTLPSHTSAKALADQFTNFFTNKIATIREGIKSSQTQSAMERDTPFSGSQLTEFHPVTEIQVKKLVCNAPTKSCELDALPTWLLKQAVDPLISLITATVNKSLSTAQVPASYKKAVVRPLLKKPDLDPEIMKNYRPVSNLPFISKVLERVVCQQLDEHLSTNCLNDNYQSAYRKCHSTETALLKVQTDILDALDSGSSVALIMLDLSAAFDTLDHDIMMERLQHSLGITSTALEWLKSYFSDRTQHAAIDSVASEEVSLQYGVPQGSVIGPKSYNMYTLPLGSILRRNNVQYMIYADDAQDYLVIKLKKDWSSAAAILEKCVSEVSDWMSANCLKLNQEKTEYIIFRPRNHAFSPADYPVQIGESTLSPAPFVNNLGVTQDSCLTMERQVNKVTRACYYHIRRIGRIRNSITTDACRTLVQATITSRLDYANVLLHGLPKSLIQKLQRVQNAAARLISRTRKRDHISPVLVQLHWLPVEYRLQYKVILYTFKAVHGTAPAYINDLISVHRPTRSLRSANQMLLTVPKSRTSTYGDRSFRKASATLWNSLPLTLRQIESEQTFKGKLKTYLFRHAHGNEL